MNRLLAGSWRYVKGGGPDVLDHAMTFTPFGDLVHTVVGREDVENRVLMLYEVEGDTLITDQPTVPEHRRERFAVEGDELRVGEPGAEVVLHREASDALSDPDAYMLAIASAALHHCLSSAVGEETFAPFLIVDSAESRQLHRITAPNVHVARAAAQRTLASLGEEFHAAAFAFQGHVAIEHEAFPAAVVEVSQRGRLYGLLLGQPFDHDEEGNVVRVAPLEVETNENWFDVPMHLQEQEVEPEEKPKKRPSKKAPAKKAAAKKGAAKKAVAKKAVAKEAVAKKGAAKKGAAKKGAAKKPASKQAVAKKATVKKSVAKKLIATKGTAKKASAKKSVAKKASAKKSVARTPAARKAIAKKRAARKAPAKKHRG